MLREPVNDGAARNQAQQKWRMENGDVRNELGLQSIGE